MRVELMVDKETEFRHIDKIKDLLLNEGYNASNSIIVTVSTDYSSIVGQMLRHELTYEGQICDGFGIEVPYPDETWNDKYLHDVIAMFKLNNIETKNIILVEAGVIRGGNYTKVLDIIRNDLKLTQSVITVSLYENVHSKFKSNFVAQYYDDTKQDLTFWWEKQNNHWI